MTSPIDRAFIRAFSKRQHRNEDATATVNPAADTAPADTAPADTAPIGSAPIGSAPADAATAEEQALTAPTRRIDTAEPSAGPTLIQWHESPVMVTSFQADSLSNSATQIDVTNNGYPEGILPEDIDALTTADPRAPEPPLAPAVTRALRPEQVVRRLDDPQAVLTPHVVKTAYQPAHVVDKEPASHLLVEELDVAYPHEDDASPLKSDEQPGGGSDVDEHAPPSNLLGGPASTELNAPRATPFVPAWETDQIQWPRMADRLIEIDDRFSATGRELAGAVRDGLRTLAITSTYRGEGRTTIAMNLARSAAAEGLQVALVDADLDNPTLASAAGIAAAHGWHECVRVELPLEEAAVASLAEGVTILPLTDDVRRSTVTTSGPEFKSMLEQLSGHYDLVIVDYGPLGVSDAQPPRPVTADAALLVRDIRCTSADQAIAAVAKVRKMGPQSVGVVQNFT